MFKKKKRHLTASWFHPGVRASTISGAMHSGFVSEGQDFVFTSKLPEGFSVSEHQKWLHGVLQLERKRLRQLQENGVAVVCRIRVRARSLDIEPEALLLKHQCHLGTEISFNP